MIEDFQEPLFSVSYGLEVYVYWRVSGGRAVNHVGVRRKGLSLSLRSAKHLRLNEGGDMGNERERQHIPHSNSPSPRTPT